MLFHPPGFSMLPLKVVRSAENLFASYYVFILEVVYCLFIVQI